MGKNRPGARGGPPAWFVFLSSVALIMGVYYLWQGAQTYLSTGGLGVEQSTEQAIIVSTATAIQRATDAIPTMTPIPTFTPVPPCQPWVVNVPSANIRLLPNITSPVVGVVAQGEQVCVIQRMDDPEWYQVDSRPETRRVDEAYMHRDVIEPLNPTETPTLSPTPLPTVTPVTPSPTVTPSVTPTVDLSASPPPTVTPMPTITPAPTHTVTPPPVISA